jgi:hypothetical protein
MATSSFTSGNPLIGLANLPRICISLDTSAAFVVLYFSVVPLAGSYVFKVSVARIGSAWGAAGWEASVIVELGLGLRALEGFEESAGGLMVYFVVMRVWERWLAV